MTPRPVTAVERMLPIRGHTASGLKQDLRVRVYAPAPDSPSGSGQIEIDAFEIVSARSADANLLHQCFFRQTIECTQIGQGFYPLMRGVVGAARC